jgi:predicted helicase
VTGQHAVVLVPSLSLLAQTLRKWTAKRQARLRYLAVCSDETVLGGGPVVSTTSELPERGPNDAAP